jgi:hypothetical protein
VARPASLDSAFLIKARSASNVYPLWARDHVFFENGQMRFATPRPKLRKLRPNNMTIPAAAHKTDATGIIVSGPT